MESNRHQRLIVVGLYVNALLLGLVAVGVLRNDRLPSLLPVAMAQQQPSVAGGAGVFVMPAQFSRDLFGCYLMDVDAQTLSAYQYFPGEKQLRLVASRSFRFDRRLEDFNTDKPSPDDVRQWIEKQDAGIRGQAPPTPGPTP